MSYEPSEPYEFKSGKRKGEVLELMMFNGNYSFLDWMLKKREEECEDQNNKDRLHRHLEWLLSKGENREPQMICPQCGEEKVKFFSTRWSNFKSDFSIGARNTCCSKRRCKEKLTEGFSQIELKPFKFSVMKKEEGFHRKVDQRRVGDLFRKVFNLSTRPDPLTREMAFDFFKQPP